MNGLVYKNNVMNPTTIAPTCDIIILSILVMIDVIKSENEPSPDPPVKAANICDITVSNCSYTDAIAVTFLFNVGNIYDEPILINTYALSEAKNIGFDVTDTGYPLPVRSNVHAAGTPPSDC